jgi:RNA polymerase sigma factor (sigma-70 family)
MEITLCRANAQTVLEHAGAGRSNSRYPTRRSAETECMLWGLPTTISMHEAAIRDDQSDQHLLEAYIGGSQAAFDALVARYGGLVHKTCRRLLGEGHPMIDDACQAVFLIMAKKSASIHSPAALASWLHRTAGYVANRAQREERRRRVREQVVAKTTALETDMDAPDWIINDLDRAIDRLSLPQREVVLRHYLQGKAHAAVARELGISEAAVKKRSAHALANLRQLLVPRAAISASALVAWMSAQASASTAPIQLAADNATATAVELSAGVMKSMFMRTLLACATATAVLAGGTAVIVTSQYAEKQVVKEAVRSEPTRPRMKMGVKSVTASAYFSAESGSSSTAHKMTSTYPEYALDGDPNTAWNAGVNAPAWIEFSFDKPRTVNSLSASVSQQPDGATVHELTATYADGSQELVHVFKGVTNRGDVLNATFVPPLLEVDSIRILTVESPSWVCWCDIDVR